MRRSTFCSANWSRSTHRFGQVVHGLQVKGVHGVLGMRRHKDQRRRLWQSLQGARQRQAIGAGHVDVDQRHVHSLVLHKGHGLHGVASLARPLHSGRRAITQKGVHAGAGKAFVVHHQSAQQATHAGRHRRHRGTSCAPVVHAVFHAAAELALHVMQQRQALAHVISVLRSVVYYVCGCVCLFCVCTLFLCVLLWLCLSLDSMCLSACIVCVLHI